MQCRLLRLDFQDFYIHLLKKKKRIKYQTFIFLMCTSYCSQQKCCQQCLKHTVCVSLGGCGHSKSKDFALFLIEHIKNAWKRNNLSLPCHLWEARIFFWLGYPLSTVHAGGIEAHRPPENPDLSKHPEFLPQK